MDKYLHLSLMHFQSTFPTVLFGTTALIGKSCSSLLYLLIMQMRVATMDVLVYIFVV